MYISNIIFCILCTSKQYAKPVTKSYPFKTQLNLKIRYNYVVAIDMSCC